MNVSLMFIFSGNFQFETGLFKVTASISSMLGESCATLCKS